MLKQACDPHLYLPFSNLGNLEQAKDWKITPTLSLQIPQNTQPSYANQSSNQCSLTGQHLQHVTVIIHNTIQQTTLLMSITPDCKRQWNVK